ncbi:MAG: DUF72 domain-containing protein [Fidelibacterota bacterium]|nr:MAG: DUF72 domain-containing protein [Candidatus Neomarinimicrobiota bacterium]
MPSESAPITDRAIQLARQAEIYLGTSSWKYEGWQGMVYQDHYTSQRAFKRRCLAEYARYFPAVGVDATFYRFPDQRLIEELDALTPSEFRFGLKVTEEITVYKYPTHPRYGSRKGQDNTNFLDGELFTADFLGIVAGLGAKLGPVIFQFGTLPRTIVNDGIFLRRLDEFLGGLPGNYQYAVEIRNRQLYNEDYFSVLKKHGVAHVHTSWSWMPLLPEQIAREASFTADYFVMRLLTAPQTAYKDAVETFFPYQRILKPLPVIREALITHLNRAIKSNQPGYVFVNNRLEGAAPLTIEQVLDQVLGSEEAAN